MEPPIIGNFIPDRISMYVCFFNYIENDKCHIYYLNHRNMDLIMSNINILQGKKYPYLKKVSKKNFLDFVLT